MEKINSFDVLHPSIGENHSYLNNVNSFDKKNILLGMIYGSAIASFTIESFGTDKIFNLSKQEIDNRYKILKKIAKII